VPTIGVPKDRMVNNDDNDAINYLIQNEIISGNSFTRFDNNIGLLA